MYTGQKIKRVDALDKVTGRTKYTDDLCDRGAVLARHRFPFRGGDGFCFGNINGFLPAGREAEDAQNDAQKQSKRYGQFFFFFFSS